jgi:hypothetical protein
VRLFIEAHLSFLALLDLAACFNLQLMTARPKKEDSKMRFYALFVALAWLSQTPAPAQDVISTTGQSIQGTWISQVADMSGNITLFEVGTFSPDGSYSGANTNPSHTTHKGVWLRTGDRKFVLTVMFFTHDDKGVFNGIVKARIYLTLAADLQSYDSVAERVVMDTSGNVLQVVPGLAGHSVRMNVELPQGPQN